MLVRQAVPSLCSQNCAWNTGPRLMLLRSILLQKSTSLRDASDSPNHIARLPSIGLQTTCFSSVQTVRVCSELLLRVVLGVCWKMILVSLHCSPGQVYKQALCVEFPSGVKSGLVENNTPRNHAPPDIWKDQLFLPHIQELVLRENPQIFV